MASFSGVIAMLFRLMCRFAAETSTAMSHLRLERCFFATANGHLVALNATNGKLEWDPVFVDVRAGESATAAPLIVKDKVIVGSSGAEYGVRGHLDGFDLQTGKCLWRYYTVPRPGEPGSDTWQQAGAWERGGGSTWITGSYDPELDLLY
jgi:alcohol dehydrogenase (cytochrome c)